MYQRRLHEIQKAADKGKVTLNLADMTFIIELNRKRQTEFTDKDKEEINKLWSSI